MRRHSSSLPVRGRGEDPQDDVPAVHPDDGAGGVQEVEVEVGVAGDGAVESGLQEGRPLLLQHALGPPLVPLAHPSHSRHHHLRAGSTTREKYRKTLRRELGYISEASGLHLRERHF